MISVIDTVLIGFGVVIVFLLWDRHKMEQQMGHIADQHNKLCNLIDDFAEQVANDLDELEEKINK